jgi:hypothetical protein
MLSSRRLRTVAVTPPSSCSSERCSVLKSTLVPRLAAPSSRMGSKRFWGRSQIFDGLARSKSALRLGLVPQVRSRASSSPARLVQNTWSPISSCGVAFSTTAPSRPTSRMISTVRWLVMCARGVFESQRYLSTRTFSTPYSLRNSAADAPAGPHPTIKTSVSIRGFTFVSSAIPRPSCPPRRGSTPNRSP